MGKQGHGRRLTDKERMEIIELTRENPRIKHVELAARYNVNESTIRKWRLSANAEKIETRYGAGVEEVRDSRQRGQVVKNAEFDASLFEWVCAARSQNVDLAPVKIRERARELAARYDGMEGFKASSGWYYRFCRRYGLPCPASRRSDASVAKVIAECTATTLPALAGGDVAVTTLSTFDGVETAVKPDEAVAIATSVDQKEEHKTDDNEEEIEAQTIVLESSEVMTPEAASYEPIGEPTSLGKRKFEDTASDAPTASAEEEHQGEERNPVAETVLQHTVELASLDSPPSPAPAPAPAPTQTQAASPAMSARQEAISHFLRHHKHLLSLSSRLRFIKHLAHAVEEAEMYTVMDDETRVEYIKEFADKSGGDAPTGVVRESLVV